MHSTIIHVHKLSSYLKKYYSCYFQWRFSAIICYFPQFVFVFVDLLLLTDFAIFFTIFHYFSSLYTFNRFSTIFYVDFPLLTDFPLFFTIFHYFLSLYILIRFSAIFFVDFPLLTDFPLFFTIFHYFCRCTHLTDFPLFFADFPHSFAP